MVKLRKKCQKSQKNDFFLKFLKEIRHVLPIYIIRRCNYMHKLVTIQSDINDCGPAVIYSLVKYYRGYVSMEKIRLDTNLSREGVTAYDIVLTLERYGFEAHGLSLTLNDIKNVSRPMILHLDYKKYNHYVLLVRVKKDICTIMDPSKGLIKMSLDDLAKVWTRIAIRAIPSEIGRAHV